MAKFKKGSKAYKQNVMRVLQISSMDYKLVSAIADVPISELKIWVKEARCGDYRF
jgi:hypothetical protein